MEIYFATMFEDISYERSIFLLLSLTDGGLFKQSNLRVMKHLY